MNQKEIESRDEKETGRVEAFSDGVFAIAITPVSYTHLTLPTIYSV